LQCKRFISIQATTIRTVRGGLNNMRIEMKRIMLVLTLLLGMMPVIMAPAPTAQTLPAESITQTSAVLVGRVNPNGLSTQVDFACCDPSASPTYFPPSSLKNIGSGNATVMVYYTLTGLAPGTTYTYTVRAINSAGSKNGGCVSFTTASGAASAILTTSKSNYTLGEPVFFTLTNTGAFAISATVNNPWVIDKKVGFAWQTAYVPGIALQNWTLNPGSSKTWSWGQTSNAMVTIDAGTYRVEVDISGVGSWSCEFTIGESEEEPAEPEEEEDDDGDGVPNSEDNCYNPDCNIVDSRGCPKDTDRDGLNDCEDRCPTEKSSEPDGCPVGDKDGDGVPDDEDGCYNPECDIVDAQGCPKDSDSDGLNDCDDECPAEYGERRNNGCPAEEVKDSDNDGVPDDQDSCYNPGCNRVDSRGCPWDSDGDGLNDCEDNCPNQSGPRSNNGCPQQGFCLGSAILSILVLMACSLALRRSQ
jgi:hypothetical protein